MIPLPNINTAAPKRPTQTRSAQKSSAKKPAPHESGPLEPPILICGAKTRASRPCRMPPVTGKTRCRMHGGTKPGSKKTGGAPKGNRNAFVHGYYSAAARAERKRLADQLRWLKKEMRELRKMKGV